MKGGEKIANPPSSANVKTRRGLEGAPGSTEEQYRTNNLVGSSITKICVVPTTSFNSYSQLSAGLDGAIANYNALGLQFRLARGSASDCSATITAKTTSGVGGSSGFPSGGKPYGTINIGVGLQSYSTGVNTHVVTHEIGHCVGFRHSDYYDRSISCGTGGNEGTAGVGAVLIPGTPSTAKVGGSVMNSCFRASESGNWSSSDKTALQYLY
ncbi:MAG TPA: M57 family metalloprotease [Myxococcales bacterium]|nr:M57 family metalloprotease [Myxococcales bacterium]